MSLFDEFAKDAEGYLQKDEPAKPGAVYTKAEVDRLLEEQAKSILRQIKQLPEDPEEEEQEEQEEEQEEKENEETE